jgi:hypothetical protein
MKKARKPTSTKRGKKRPGVKDLSAKRAAATKGGGSYTMFLPSGTPVVARRPATASKEPSNIEFPN